jgi:hypothetical protein
MVDMNEINYEWVFLTPYLKKKKLEKVEKGTSGIHQEKNHYE